MLKTSTDARKSAALPSVVRDYFAAEFAAMPGAAAFSMPDRYSLRKAVR